MKVVLAYVRTPEGGAAFEAAVQESLLRSAELVIMGAVQFAPGENPSAVREEIDRAESADHVLEELAVAAGERGVQARAVPLRLQRSDSVADSVVRLTDREEADLLVVGVRRRSPVGKAVLGSESQDIILQANCPVLAVKAD